MAGTMALLQIALLASAPHGAGKIDFHAKAIAAGPLIERLAAQTGARLKASSTLDKEIVYVQAKGVQLDDLKAKLAEAMLAEWKTEGDTEYLTRTAELDRRRWRDHIAFRRKLVDEALKEARKQTESPFDGQALATGLLSLRSPMDATDQTAARRLYLAEKAMFAKGPLARLTNRLVLACNPDDLAAIGPFERRIFRLDPTRLQRAFDRRKYEAAMADFAAEQQAWIDEAAKVVFPEPKNGRMVSDPRSQLRIEPKPTRIALEVRRGEITSLFMVNLTSEDVPPFGYTIVNQVVFADPWRKFLDAQMAAKPAAAEDPLVDLSEDSAEFRQRVIDAFRSREPNPISKRMWELILNVEHNDPLSWIVGDGLDAIAKLKNANLVAAVPDGALSTAVFSTADQPLHARQLLDALIDSGRLELRESGGWAVLTPPDRYEAALDFTPRAAVAKLMRTVFDTGRLDIRDYARYAFETKMLNRGGLGDWFLAMNDRSLLGASDRTDWSTLQLFGSLSPAMQGDLEAGRRVRCSGLNSEQAAILSRILYRDRLIARSLTPDGIEQTFANAVEPSGAFPNGTPAECYISATVQEKPTIVAYGKGSDGKSRPMRGLDAWNLAGIETDVVGNPTKMQQYGVANLLGYALGSEKSLGLRVEPAPNVFAYTSITIPDYKSGVTPVRWDQLPDPWPKQISAAIEQYKAQKANQQGRNAPPPGR